MKDIQIKLLEFAKSDCMSYLLNLPVIAPYSDQISFVLVGSVASGLCQENSDIDIALICDDKIYKIISKNSSWDKGIPTETKLNGIQLHYFGITSDKIKAKLEQLDDIFLFVYSNVIILKNEQKIESLNAFIKKASKIRRQRIEGKLDMLLRRLLAFKQCLIEKDIMVTYRICMDLITICLKVIALLDNVPFDPRKRFFKTALSGELGQKLQRKVQIIFSELGKIGQQGDDEAFIYSDLPGKFDDIVQCLSDETVKQGFRVGLEKPDYRHMEN